MENPFRRSLQAVVFATLFCCLAGSDGLAEDWPMWRYDAKRSAASPEALPEKLHLQWVRHLPRLRPAWPVDGRLRYDGSYQPIVMGKRLFVGSSVNDTMTAYDTETGELVWTFYAGAPVRLAPVGWKDKIYFVSDDGYLYCLKAADGSLIRRFRGGPLTDRRIVGNGRLVSMLPARGGPVIHKGKLFFAAGLWPFMGTFVYALDPDSGKVLWCNSGTGFRMTVMPHGGKSLSGPAPEGYMVGVGDRLLVQCGRASPAVFDCSTGRLLHYSPGQGGKSGNWFSRGSGDYYFNGGNIFSFKNHKRLIGVNAPQVFTEDRWYTGGGVTTNYMHYGARSYHRVALSALDASKPRRIEGKDKRGRAMVRWEFPTIWSMDYKAAGIDRLWLSAGRRLYASQKKVVKAFDQPSEAGKAPSKSWEAALEGTPSGMLAADGRLFVVTREGGIFCFGATAGEPKRHAFKPAALSSATVPEAERILKATGVSEGYCLVLGLERPGLVEGLLAASKCHVIAVDSDAEKVDALRRKLDGAGLYGKRASVHAGNPLTFRFPPYIASLIVVSNANIHEDQRTLERLFQVLRPYGGTAWLGVPQGMKSTIAKQVAAAELAGAVLETKGGMLCLKRSGALPGSADWTHAAGDAARTNGSKDMLVKAPLGVLWFGTPVHKNRSSVLITEGRVLLQTAKTIETRDAYTGRLMWRKESEGTTGTVFMPGGIYLNRIKTVLRLDPSTGETLSEFKLPDTASAAKAGQRRGFLACQKNTLVADVAPFNSWRDNTGKTRPTSKKLLGLDRASGKIAWTFEPEGRIPYNTITVGRDKVFFLDEVVKFPGKLSRDRKRRDNPVLNITLIALDLETGKIVWQKKKGEFSGYPVSHSNEHDLLFMRGGNLIALKSEDGSEAWKVKSPGWRNPAFVGNRIVFTQSSLDLLTGKPTYCKDPVTESSQHWTYHREYGCGGTKGTPNLLLFRSGTTGFCDLTRHGGTGNLGGFRPECRNNLIPANGIINVHGENHCACNFNIISVSMGLIHMPEAEMWTWKYIKRPSRAAVKRVGINFGAPGDRMDDNGTYWMDYPSVGFKSPDIPVRTEPEQMKTFRLHTSRMGGNAHKWVGASGMEGAGRIVVSLSKELKKDRIYTVSLYFAEPNPQVAPGKRVFDVSLQGKQVLKGFDVVKEGGGPRRVFVKTFESITVRNDLEIILSSGNTGQGLPAVICGVEAVITPAAGE